MNNKIFKGIALILFGILLCMSTGELNNVVLTGLSYIPFSLIGVICGAVGLAMVFSEDKDK